MHYRHLLNQVISTKNLSFNSLPLHPQPEPLESFTSYLIRLAEENHIDRPQSLFLLFGGDDKMKRTADYPHYTIERLSLAAACDKANLLRTTFHHLARKFDRSDTPTSIAPFLKGSISQSFRYCPLCIKERSYYSLMWRFLWLSGCADHGCQLLERCNHCGHALPFITASLQIGICPVCRCDLRTCLAEPLTQNALSVTRVRTGDLMFLLSPQPWEDSGDILLALGRQFAHRRKNKQFTQDDIDAQAGFLWNKTRDIELRAIHGNSSPPRRLVAFRHYLTYADFLGVSLVELLTAAQAQKAEGERPNTGAQHVPAPRYLHHAKGDENVEYGLQAARVPEVGILASTAPIIGEEIKVSLKDHSQEEHLSPEEEEILMLHKGSADKKGIREQEWLTKVQRAYEHLVACGEQVTVKAICHAVPVSCATLNRHFQIKAYLATIVKGGMYQARRKEAQLREERLVAAVQHAISQLRESGQLVTQGEIAKLVNQRIKYLRNRPSVKMLLDQVSIE